MISALIGDLRALLGTEAVKDQPCDTAPHVEDWRGRFRGLALCVIEPSTAQNVATALSLVAAHGASAVPQGGNTGLVGGATPLADCPTEQVVVSLRRMNRIIDVDPLDNVIVAEAGVILQHAQEAARAQGCLLPISLGSEGSAQIGGVVSTNAGGTNVLRWGSTRELVLGLEVALADGTVWNGLHRLRKNNMGYDLKQLFIGAEGTLGIVTAAALKLVPMPHSRATAFIAVASPKVAVELLHHFQRETGDFLTTFELIQRACLDLVLETVQGAKDPLDSVAPWYVLAEVSTSIRHIDLDDILLESLGAAMELGLVADAVLARGESHRADFWRLRDSISEAERKRGPSAKHDISVPISRIAEFLERVPDVVRSTVVNAVPIAFGHVGDGNIHFNVLTPVEHTDAIARAVYDLVFSLEGSISAEHGIGSSKVNLLSRYKDAASMDLMRRIRTALDPLSTLNPGKLLEVRPD